MPSWLGDCVMAMPVVHALLDPSARCGLTLALPGAFMPAVAGVPVDACVHRPRSMIAAIRARDLRPRFDCAIVLPNSLSSAVHAKVAFRPDELVGRQSAARRLLLNRPVKVAHDLHSLPTIDLYCLIAESWLGRPIADRTPRLPVTDLDRIAAQRALGTLAEQERRMVVLNPGASRESKRWPATRYREIALRLAAAGYRVVVAGAPAERALCASVCDGNPDAVNLADSGAGLGGLRAVLASAVLLVTNDTGTRHLAAAVGCPWVCVFGSEPSILSRWPHDSGIEIVPSDGRCDSVTTDSVWEAIVGMVSPTP